MYIKRKLEKSLLVLAKQYPVVTITGPRQSGKTTLCKQVFKNKLYLSLEDPDNRDFAREDPRSFLKQGDKGLIIDEIQRVPELMSYIQTIVDTKKQKGQFILTGSQQFELMASLTQSLAGRTAIIKLLPLSYDELPHKSSNTIEEILYRGFYPKIHAEKITPTTELSFYTTSYLERDVRLITNIKNLKTFESFLTICAGRTGQLLNYANISNEIGIDIKTIKNWLNILEASYIIKIVTPYYKKMTKRVVKAPKLYFLDTGLACYLLKIKNSHQLTGHPLLGSLFETFVFNELLKNKYNNIETDNLYFYRDHRGNEVDFIFDNVTNIDSLEIKLSKTVTSNMFKGLQFLQAQNNYVIDQAFLVYGGNKTFIRNNVHVVSWKNIAEI